MTTDDAPITLAHGGRRGRAEAARAHHGEPGGRASAAAYARRARRCTPAGSSSRSRGRTIVGCAELAPLSSAGGRGAVARGRRKARAAAGVGVMIVDELRRRARREGFEKLCAFTHAPGYFIHMGFSIVPHLWLPEKIFTDCVKCPQFRQCGQYAMVVPLDSAFDADRRLRRSPSRPHRVRRLG